MSQINAQKICIPSSFTINPFYIPSYSDEINVFNINANPIVLPVGFNDSKDYIDTCVDNRIFKLSKSSNTNI